MLPAKVSLTYTEPLAAVAEKFGAENVIGATLVPIEPPVDASTNVFAPLIVASEPVIELVEIKVIDPEFVTFIVLFVSEIPAFAPDACNMTLLPDSVEAAAKLIVLPGPAVLLLSKNVPVVALTALAPLMLTELLAFMNAEPFAAFAVSVGVEMLIGERQVPMPVAPPALKLMKAAGPLLTNGVPAEF